MTGRTISKLGELLGQYTHNIAAHDTFEATQKKGDMLHVPDVANAVLYAYEQLRNASENIEDHLLLQRAILRFYRRTLPLGHALPKNLARELIIELSQAEYLPNDSVLLSRIDAIDEIITRYHASYVQATAGERRKLEKWLLELLAVETEQVLSNPVRIISFARFVHAHLSEIIDFERILRDDTSIAKQDYATLLYIAIHKALLRSDDANIRSELLELHKITPAQTKQFIAFNETYDTFATSSAAIKLTRFVNKNGAPLRILRATFFEESDSPAPINLGRENETMNTIEATVDREYQEVRKRVSKGVLRSVIFLFITKSIVGLFIEIPYDIAIYGSIIVLPLVVNLLFPPIFLALTALTFRIPGTANKRAIVDHLNSLLYVGTDTKPTLRYTETVDNRAAFNVIYVAVFIGVFWLIADRLAALDFNIVQGVIFVVFLSTASFLGYRLTLQIKELELITTHQGFLALVRDFLYAPFIFVGQRISYRFSQLNLTAQILDAAIDLPLKTMVRLVRQWTVFLNNKKDELI